MVMDFKSCVVIFVPCLYMCRQLSHGAGAFFGITDSDQGDSASRWLQRRAAFHGSSVIMGHAVSEKCKEKLEIQDDALPCPTPRDPYHRPGMV